LPNQNIYKMKLEHIAITITDYIEIKQFYLEILGMNELRSFSLDKPLVREIFGIEESTTVVQVQKDLLNLEIFISDRSGNLFELKQKN